VEDYKSVPGWSLIKDISAEDYLTDKYRVTKRGWWIFKQKQFHNYEKIAIPKETLEVTKANEGSEVLKFCLIFVYAYNNQYFYADIRPTKFDIEYKWLNNGKVQF